VGWVAKLEGWMANLSELQSYRVRWLCLWVEWHATDWVFSLLVDS
jgi:hypothetical protein